MPGTSKNPVVRKAKAARKRERLRMREKCNAIVAVPRPSIAQPLRRARWDAAAIWLDFDEAGEHGAAREWAKLPMLAVYDAIAGRAFKREAKRA